MILFVLADIVLASGDTVHAVGGRKIVRIAMGVQ
jgi:hypothetical protein